MSRKWIHENPARWDASKSSILGADREGALGLQEYGEGDLIPGEWWRVEEDGRPVGYGWMDCTWGDAEILLAVDAGHRNRGVGAYILDRLESEAAGRGLNYLFNEVRETHPDPDSITRWLTARRFEASHDDRLLRRRVRPPDPAAGG
jgi:GNAT superfamily N-acetyltransferase